MNAPLFGKHGSKHCGVIRILSWQKVDDIALELQWHIDENRRKGRNIRLEVYSDPIPQYPITEE